MVFKGPYFENEHCDPLPLFISLRGKFFFLNMFVGTLGGNFQAGIDII